MREKKDRGTVFVPFDAGEYTKYIVPALDKFIDYEVDFKALFEITVDDIDDVKIEELSGSKKLDNIISEVKSAVKYGRIALEDIDDSVERILLLKERRGILDLSEDKRTFEERLTEAEAIVDSPRNRAVERVVAEEAVTVVKNEGATLPMKPEGDEKILFLATTNSPLVFLSIL